MKRVSKVTGNLITEREAEFCRRPRAKVFLRSSLLRSRSKAEKPCVHVKASGIEFGTKALWSSLTLFKDKMRT